MLQDSWDGTLHMPLGRALLLSSHRSITPRSATSSSGTCHSAARGERRRKRPWGGARQGAMLPFCTGPCWPLRQDKRAMLPLERGPCWPVSHHGAQRRLAERAARRDRHLRHQQSRGRAPALPQQRLLPRRRAARRRLVQLAGLAALRLRRGGRLGLGRAGLLRLQGGAGGARGSQAGGLRTCCLQPIPSTLQRHVDTSTAHRGLGFADGRCELSAPRLRLPLALLHASQRRLCLRHLRTVHDPRHAVPTAGAQALVLGPRQTRRSASCGVRSSAAQPSSGRARLLVSEARGQTCRVAAPLRLQLLQLLPPAGQNLLQGGPPPTHLALSTPRHATIR
jgi:hypothetical protein